MQIISVPFSHSLVETERLKLHCDRDATDRLEFILKDFFFFFIEKGSWVFESR